ncbi:MAG: dUTP diphosphatase [Candidatus Riflebacteria bacterium]|nr:dUTP diphosphatase [Candidatus Riflebacteria bacterium]
MKQQSSEICVEVIEKDKSLVPQKATPGSSGYDLKSRVDCEIAPGEIKLVPAGIRLQIPAGLEAQVRPRSGLAAKHGITVLNSPGTIDSDYRGEVCVILINHSKSSFKIEKGMRIAQMVFAQVADTALIQVSDLDHTDRGSGGFGSTGVL